MTNLVQEYGYNSKQIILCPDVEIIKIYNIRILVQDYGKIGLQTVISIEGKFFERIEELAMNDGLFIEDFLSWFYNKKEEIFVGQIICWKDINYLK